ncbi:MAG: hypothetical protein J6386_15725 [Candidatus Synoicihabitans palmerolidicus]|nr:hypothetical protein [Candidatus Synoicihabitans palmerolidicus]
MCTDADTAAIDRAHELAKSCDGRMQTAVLDFVHPMVSSFGEAPHDRLRSDGVIALAVSHHLLLTQRVPLDRLLQSIASYAERFVVVEFMPSDCGIGNRRLRSRHDISWSGFALRVAKRLI